MGAVMITAMAQKETAKQALLKQLRELGATSPQMPGSLEIDSDEKQAVLAELLAAGEIRQGRAGLYYLDEAMVKPRKRPNGFLTLLAIIVSLSFTASFVALAWRAG